MSMKAAYGVSSLCASIGDLLASGTIGGFVEWDWIVAMCS